MLPQSLEAFIGPMLAMAGAQFPRACGSCRRSYGDFKQFVLETKPIGSPTLVEGDAIDPIGMVSWTNCACKSTLVLFCADSKGDMHGRFMRALETESAVSGRSVRELALSIREEVRRRVLNEP